MRRRMGLAEIGPVVGLLMVVLLAACGQSEATPGATASPPRARLGIPGTPNLATPVTPIGVFSPTTVVPASPTPTSEK